MEYLHAFIKDSSFNPLVVTYALKIRGGTTKAKGSCSLFSGSKEELVLSATHVGDKMKTDFVKANQVKNFL